MTILTQLKVSQFPVSAWHLYGLSDAENNSPKNSLVSGGRLNKKDGLTRYGESHDKDKTS